MGIERGSFQILTDAEVDKVASAKIGIDAECEEEHRYRRENKRDDGGYGESDPTCPFVGVGSE